VQHQFLEGVAFGCIGAVVYSYVLYPFVLLLLASVRQTVSDVAFVLRKVDRRRRPATELPAVDVVIAAFDEEAHIARRIENLLGLDYPADRLCVRVGSDGSSDGTADLLRAVTDPRVDVQIYPANRGKASVLNDLAERATAPILVFSDANTEFDNQALRRLVAHFDDERVGGVSGELRLKRASGDNQDSLYWRIEQMLKTFEARIGALLGANGAIYAIRRELWRPLRVDTICDDFCVAMNVAAMGRRLVYDPTAWAEEDTPSAIGDEYHRRVRIGIGNFQALARQPEYLFRTSVPTAFAYLSHKVLRWIAPHLLLLALFASLLLAIDSTPWRVAAAAQILIYLGAAALYWRSLSGRRLGGLMKIFAFLFALNWAFLAASARFATGRYRGSWRRSVR
jgi:cellulose synthase/poly-beta-1,6-N-acetylglucosamine synthase-like glycosyltransferase